MKEINKMFDAYLARVKLSRDQMSEVQYTETKRAFMAGISSLYVHLIIGVPNHFGDNPELWEERADNINRELREFWREETKE